MFFILFFFNYLNYIIILWNRIMKLYYALVVDINAMKNALFLKIILLNVLFVDDRELKMMNFLRIKILKLKMRLIWMKLKKIKKIK